MSKKQPSLAKWLQSAPQRPTPGTAGGPSSSHPPTPPPSGSSASPPDPTAPYLPARGRGRGRGAAPPTSTRPGPSVTSVHPSALPLPPQRPSAAVGGSLQEALRVLPVVVPPPRPPTVPRPQQRAPQAPSLIEERLLEEQEDDIPIEIPRTPQSKRKRGNGVPSPPAPKSTTPRTPKTPRSRLYKRSWENEPMLRGWLAAGPAGTATCTVCNVQMRPHHADLVKHATKSATHLANMEKYNVARQQRLDNIGIQVESSIDQKTIDLKLAVYIATHTAVRGIDHLTEILKEVGKGSSLENLRLHRTKCSALISKVIAPVMLTELVADIGDSGYSLMIDESTDISVTKFMAIVVKFHSKQDKLMKTDFLGFVEVYRATANDLYAGLKEYLTKIGLDYKKCIGLGCDGASSLCGRNHSVYTLFKAEVPNLVLIRCVCHSLHGAASKAANVLPADLEFLVRESRNWFARSPLKRLQYRDLFAAINEGEMPKSLVQLVQTRWLAWNKAIEVVLSQWLELKAHFDQHQRSIRPADKCVIGRKLHECYQNDSLQLYLLFLKPVTAKLNKINLKFQATDSEVTTAFADIDEFIVSLVRKFLKPEHQPRFSSGEALSDEAQQKLRAALSDDRSYLPRECVDYGGAFAVRLGQVSIAQGLLQEVQTRCIQYYATLVINLLEILPEHSDRLSALRYLAQGEASKSVGRADFFKLPFHLADPAQDLDDLKEEWDSMALVNWQDYFQGNIPQSSIDFWLKVHDYSTPTGEYKFREIAGFALRVLSLPFTNAVVERIFSIMNAVKVKARNRLNIDMLVAIIRIRQRLRSGRTGSCCHQFTPTRAMLDLFTQDIYSSVSKETLPSAERVGERQPDLEETINLLPVEEGSHIIEF